MKILLKLSGFFLISIMFIYGCSKFNDKNLIYINPDLPIIINSVDSTSDSSCTITAKIDNADKPKILYQGVCWGITPNPVYDSSFHLKDTTTSTQFSIKITGLQEKTLYYSRTFAVNSAGVAYGKQLIFHTPAKSLFAYGQPYAGGIVFYIDSTGQGGLVCDTTDLKDSIQIRDSTGINIIGANFYDSIQWRTLTGFDNSGASATAIGSGSNNTLKIIASDSSIHTAAKLCNNYRGGGYSDWYLPSKDELNQIYLNLTARGAGNMSPTNYWSSSNNITSTGVYAWAQYFGNGNQYYFKESFFLNVRAVRKFSL